MELIEIAQLVTGLATLIVASVLIWQMIIQKKTLDIAHTDSEVLITMNSMSMNADMQLASITNSNLSDILFQTKKNGRKDLDDKEKEIFYQWCWMRLGRLATEWRLGRMDNDPTYYEIHLMNHLINKGAREHYIENREGLILGTKWREGLVEIADKVYEEAEKNRR